jgi:hypothetical protein
MSKHEENAIKARTYNFWGDNQVYAKTIDCPVVAEFNAKPVFYTGFDFSGPTDELTLAKDHYIDAFRYYTACINKVQVPRNLTELNIKVKIVPTHSKTCTCGTRAVYGEVPISSHAHYCDLRIK